ncbi:hypothetical protein B1A85_06760 [Chroococcidiopsis sp. TS-821]|nr:hypothetical protein B1A85_06760 [Chroococcidiopsis sp. TS-821]
MFSPSLNYWELYSATASLISFNWERQTEFDGVANLAFICSKTSVSGIFPAIAETHYLNDLIEFDYPVSCNLNCVNY